MPAPELISFKSCPYVMRSLILLFEKRVAFDRTEIDLTNKPDWFLKISPLGKVPVLRVGDDVLFESNVIADYLDEVYAPQMHPSDPLLKAKNRAWMEFSSQTMSLCFAMSNASEAGVFNEKRDAFVGKLQQLEQQVVGSFFNGAAMAVVDCVLAPLFLMIDIIRKHTKADPLEGYAKLQTYADNLLARPSVQQARPDDYTQHWLQARRNKNSYLVLQYGNEPRTDWA